jgi:antitoxin CcdA
MNKVIDPKTTRRKAVNVSLASDVVAKAKDLGINISEVAETALRSEVRRATFEKWKEENRDAIDNYNRRIRKHGLFSEGLRRF